MTIRGIKDYLRNKTWVFLKAKWKLRSGVVARIENDSDWFVFNEIFTNKEYDAAFDLFLPLISKQPLILDLGANVGYFTLRISDELLVAGYKDFQIISLEASPSNYEVLRYRLNDPMLKDHAKSFLGLAGHKSGSNKVTHSQQHYGHSSAGEVPGKNAMEVGYVNIEELIADTTKRVDILKCDIEGSEEIFISAYPDLLKRTDNAVFEFHAGECNIENCRIMLREAGLLSKGVIKEDPAFKTSVEIFSRD